MRSPDGSQSTIPSKYNVFDGSTTSRSARAVYSEVSAEGIPPSVQGRGAQVLVAAAHEADPAALLREHDHVRRCLADEAVRPVLVGEIEVRVAHPPQLADHLHEDLPHEFVGVGLGLVRGGQPGHHGLDEAIPERAHVALDRRLAPCLDLAVGLEDDRTEQPREHDAPRACGGEVLAPLRQAHGAEVLFEDVGVVGDGHSTARGRGSSRPPHSRKRKRAAQPHSVRLRGPFGAQNSWCSKTFAPRISKSEIQKR